MTQIGPVEVIIVGFPGNQFSGEIIPALQEVVARGDIRIIDFALIAKDDEGNTAIVEIEETQNEALAILGEAIEDVLGLLNDDDLANVADAIPAGSSAAAIVFEHAWARELSGAVSGAAGQVIFSERIPRDVVVAALEAIEA